MRSISFKKFQMDLQSVAQSTKFQPHELETTLANLVVVQLINQSFSGFQATGFLKGGTGMQVRFGLRAGRATRDVDISLGLSAQEIMQGLVDMVGQTWELFGIKHVALVATANPRDIPEHEKILKFKIQVLYGNTFWRSVNLEVSVHDSHPELDHEPVRVSSEIVGILQALDLSVLSQVRIISPELQLAQKLHALSSPNANRGRDIYDINVLIRQHLPKLELLARLCHETFIYRNKFPWVGFVRDEEPLREPYAEAIDGIIGAPTFEEALADVEALMKLVEPHVFRIQAA